MKKLTVVCAAAAALLAAGCAYDRTAYYGGADYGAYGYGPYAYYDDYYGPFYDGYWGPSGVFFFSEGVNRPFRSDDGRHFRREAANGFHRVTPMGRPGGGMRPGGVRPGMGLQTGGGAMAAPPPPTGGAMTGGAMR